MGLAYRHGHTQKNRSQQRGKHDMQLYDIIDMRSQQGLFEESHTIFRMLYPKGDYSPIEKAVQRTVAIYEGKHDGLKACNTGFHDLQHTLETFLAMGRLMHGVLISTHLCEEREYVTGLIAALFHDIGYIQRTGDDEGTGAKYTKTHVPRGIDMLQDMGKEFGLSTEEVENATSQMLYTDLAIPVVNIDARDQSVVRCGQVLGTADLMAQMADRNYLEKLIYLYREFEEGGVPGFSSELDLLHKTSGFYSFIDSRLQGPLENYRQYMRQHFKHRWDMDADPYQEAIEANLDHLNKILSMPDADPLDLLMRGGIIEAIRAERNLQH